MRRKIFVNSLYFIIPVAVVFCALAIKAFFWAIDNRQFDDLENEGKRILFDDELLDNNLCENKLCENKKTPPPASIPQKKSADESPDA